MTPRSRCLVPPTELAAGGATLLYSAPPGFFVLLHSIRVVNSDDEPRAITIGYGNPPEEAPLLYLAEVQGQGVLVDQSWTVMPDGAELYATPSITGVLFVAVHGAVLGP